MTILFALPAVLSSTYITVFRTLNSPHPTNPPWWPLGKKNRYPSKETKTLPLTRRWLVT